jgi:hypothetical protein
MTTPVERERIRQAHRAALRNRLMSDGFLSAGVDAWIEWTMHYGGDEQDRPSFWQALYECIPARLEAGHSPGDGKEPVLS